MSEALKIICPDRDAVSCVPPERLVSATASSLSSTVRPMPSAAA